VWTCKDREEANTEVHMSHVFFLVSDFAKFGEFKVILLAMKAKLQRPNSVAK
jgi:hypothetical protein